MRLSGGIGKDRDAHPVLPMMPGSPAGAHPQARPRAQADISSCSYKTCCSSAPITLGSPATDIPARFSTLTSMPCLTCVPGVMIQQLLVKIPAPNKMKSFKAEHPLDKRKAEAEKILSKYPDRIPVICEKADRSEIADIDKKKYLVPADLSVGQFIYVIRKRIRLPPEKAIFIFINNYIPPPSAAMSTIYEEKKDEDGFLYITYSGENTFGGAAAAGAIDC